MESKTIDQNSAHHGSIKQKSLDSRIKEPLENMINRESKDEDLLALIKYIAEEDKLEKVLENPQVIKTPVVP